MTVRLQSVNNIT